MLKTNIEVERVRQQMTKLELAQLLGISMKTYSNYVQEKTPIPSDVLVKMADLFGCQTDYLLEHGNAAKS